MDNPKVHQFDPVIYPFKIWICVGCDLNAVMKEQFFDGETKAEVEFIGTDNYEALCQSVMHKQSNHIGAVIFFNSKKSMSVKNMAHEASHAAKFLFDHIGADCSVHEPFEYVVGWIAQCCESVRKLKK